MSDEEELRRWSGHADESYGEVIVEMQDEDSFVEDMRDLGLVTNE